MSDIGDLIENIDKGITVDLDESKYRILVEEFKKYKGELNESGGNWDKEKSNLYQHALHELKLAGLFDEDSDYGGMIGKAVMDMVEAFCKQGHSGGSASIFLQIMPKLLNFEHLTPITDNPEDWMNIGEAYPDASKGTSMESMFQCRRNPALFSTDGGKTYYHLDENPRVMHNSEHKDKGEQGNG